MQLFNKSVAILLNIVCIANFLHAQKPHTPKYNQPDPFVINTVSIIRQPYAEEGLPRVPERRRSVELTVTPEVMARQFLEENIDLFNMKTELEDLVIEKIQQSPGGYHIKFYQA